MASDAKIGLLVGLVFIFVIAFVLNGLPRFGNAKDGNELAAVMVSGPPNIKPAIPPDVLPPKRVPKRPPGQTPPPSKDKDRFRGQLPGTTSSEKIDKNIEPVKPASSGVHYVVCEGDNLADIAKKFYGSKEGNRRVNVMRLFEANRRLLESPDEIFVGQRLVIPPLEASERDKNRIDSIFPDSMFEEVESIGRRHF